MSVEHYEQGHEPGDFNHVQDRIQRLSQNAIVYDAAEDRWEAWVDGRMENGALSSEREAHDQIREAQRRSS